MTKHTFILAFLSHFLVMGCAKDESSKVDQQAPSVQLLAPDSLTEYYSGSNLPIIANISENDALHEIRVEVTNITKNEVVFSTHTHNHSQNVLYETSVYLADTTANQQYNIKVTASDHVGNTSTKEILKLIRK